MRVQRIHQAGPRGAVATGSGSWVPAGGQGQVYGLTVTGPGLIPYVDPAFRVEDGPVEIRVETLASLPRGKMAADGLLGDVDGNGQVDLSDALLVASYSEDPSLSIPNGDITLGDVNRDGQVDLADARFIVAYHADPSDLSLPEGIGVPVGADDEGPRLYWTDAGSDRIQRAHLDGSGVEDVVDSGLVYPRGLAVDLAASKLYWTDYGTDKIQRANLDGSEIEDLVTTGLQTPLALALDAVAGKLYWSDNGTDKIQRANLDGSEVEDLVTGLQSPLSLALDVAGGKLYWTDSGTDMIQRANLDGSEIEDLVTTGLSIPRGLALDVAGGKLYWTDNGTDKIQRANLDGTEVEDLVTIGLETPRGLIVDAAAGKLYWTDSGTDKIQRSNLDGSEVEDLVSEGLQSPRGLALARTPTAADNHPPVAVSLLYWTDARTDRIQRSNLDGSDIRTLVTGLKQPRDIALDRDGGRMYWTDSVVDKIRRANLDGSHAEDLVVEGLKAPFGIALDLARGKMYWTDWGIDKIQRANLDGSEIEDLVTDGLNEPYGLALDVAGGKMYWTDWGADKIQRANLDGSEVEDLVTGLNQPRGIALDVAGGKMYWPDWGTDKIQRANLDGSQVEDLVTEGLRTSQAIALDLGGGKMYWTDYGTDKIQRANLDGSEVEDLVTEGLKEPYGLTLGAGLPAQILKVEGEAATLNLAGRFRDPEGGALTYTVSSNDEAVATASLKDSELTITPVSTGRVTVAVTARDEGGMETTLPVAVTVEPETLASSGDGAVTVEPKTPETSGGGGSNTGGGGGTPPPTQNNAPDLVIESPSVSNSSPDAATSFTLSVTVRNSGNGSSASTTLHYYRSTDRSISSSDTQVGTGEVGALTASGTNSEEIEISLTAPTDAGTYYYGACVDAVSGESATGNNCSSGVQVTVSAPPPPPSNSPDLDIYALVVTRGPGVDLEGTFAFSLSVGVRNDGNVTSAATTLRYYRSTDATISADDTEVGTDAVDDLAPAGTSNEQIDLTTQPNEGTYYIACVDAVAGESNSDNNCSSIQVGVVPPPPPPPATSPDLVVGSPSVSDNTPDGGGTFTLSATVSNTGDGSAAATTLRYYRSTDATIPTDDTQVGTDDVSALAASGTSSEEISLTAPTDAGTYYYGACVGAVSGESDTGNNCSGGVQVTVSAPPPPPPATAPDLVVGSPSVTDSSPETGGSFTLSATVSNTGDGSAAATTLRYYRSTDATIPTDDTQVGTDDVSALAASGTSSEEISLTAPTDAGTYYYGACVDAVTGESDTGNNCSSAVAVTVVVQETQPDLTVTLSITPPSGFIFHVGSSFGFGATVVNSGEAASGPTTLRFYQSEDATITTSDKVVGTVTVEGLASPGGTSKSVELTAPVTPGTYYYNACVDAVPGESNTTNNCSFVSIGVTVVPEADLVVGSLSVTDSSPETGGSFTLSATVSNTGAGSAAATTLRYYRSTDATIPTGDTQVGTDDVSALAASGTSSEEISLTAPTDAGTYYYGACVDAVSGESDTGNNCSSGVQVTVSAPPPPPGNSPDLDIHALVVSHSPWVDPGGAFGFSLEVGVQNDGDVTSAATTLRYYRSADATFSADDTEVGTDTVDALAPAVIRNEQIDLTTQPSEGTYYIACVDAVAGESNTQNNCGSIQVGESN